ncbi:MAG: c-type cytochrome [Usitatibacter sp.]
MEIETPVIGGMGAAQVPVGAVVSLFNSTHGGGMKISRKFRAIALAHVGAALIGSCAAALAAEKLDVGKMQYDSACAVCHGPSGKGDGPLKSQLVSRVPDLTVLARDNNGVFPFDRVYQIIDGRQEIKAHGPREMPIWGRAFNLGTSVFFENYPPSDIESNARSRILALTEYLYRLQGK